MSAKYTFLAWETNIDNAPLKLALLQLANNADDNGFSFYSISKMAVACGMSERTFMRKISELEKLKILTVERRPNRPSLYTLIGDEMGVSLCHLQTIEVTESHAGVTESHLVGDRESHDPNNDPNTNPKSILNVDLKAKKQDDKAKKERFNYEEVREVFNRVMTKGPNVAKLSEKRKRLIKKLFKFAEFDITGFENYISYINSSESWNWCFEHRTGANNINYKPCAFEYFIREDTYLKAKEEA